MMKNTKSCMLNLSNLQRNLDYPSAIEFFVFWNNRNANIMFFTSTNVVYNEKRYDFNDPVLWYSKFKRKKFQKD